MQEKLIKIFLISSTQQLTLRRMQALITLSIS